MNRQEILTKAIEKAVAGGWKPTSLKWIGYVVFDLSYSVQFSTEEGRTISYSLNDLIFNHEFAKALWDEKRFNWSYPSYDGNTAYLERTAWEYHLQQMIIAEDPIAYLGENI